MSGRISSEILGVTRRWFKRRWEESRGDDFDFWGAATYYFEVGDDGWPLRQVEVYDSGRVLRYDGDHPEDKFGGLGQVQIGVGEDWSALAVTSGAFDRAWSRVKVEDFDASAPEIDTRHVRAFR